MRFLSDLLRRVGLVSLSAHMKLSNELVDTRRQLDAAHKHARTQAEWMARADERHAATARKLIDAQAELRQITYSTPGELHMQLKGAEAAAQYFEGKWLELEDRIHRPFRGITWDKEVSQDFAYDAYTYRLAMRPYAFMVQNRDHFGRDEREKRDTAWRIAWELAKGFEQDILQMLGVRP